MFLPAQTPTATLAAVLSAVHTAPLDAAATLLRRLDLPGPLGDVASAVVSAGETVAGAAQTAAGAANDVGDTLNDVKEAKEMFDHARVLLCCSPETDGQYYDLWQHYKDLIYLGLVIFGIIILLCFVNCAIQWCRNCCCCVKLGYKCTKWGWTGLGWCCIQSKRFVWGLEQAIEDAHRRGKEYDGMDQTGWRRWMLGGMRVPDNLKDAAHQKWWGDSRGWFGRNIASIWHGNTSRTVRDFAQKGEVIWIRWDGDGRMEMYKETSQRWIKRAKKYQKKFEAKLAKRGWVEGPRPEDVEKLAEAPPSYNDATASGAAVVQVREQADPSEMGSTGHQEPSSPSR